MPTRPVNLAVTAAGMVSSLGLDWKTGCAAARAGIARPAPLETFPVLAGDTAEEEPLHAHVAPMITDGFTGLGRLVRLGSAALADALRNRTFDVPPGLLVNLPSGSYLTEWHQRREDQEGINLLIDDRYETELRNEKYSAHLVPRLIRAANLDVDAIHQSVLFEDHTGIAMSLVHADMWLSSGRIEQCLVGGIGSHIESSLLEALAGLDMLKTPSRGEGLIPGEAAGFFLVERAESRRLNPENALAVIDTVTLTTEAGSSFSSAPSYGRALSNAIDTTLQSVPLPDVMIGDLNGEARRSKDWGGAVVELAPQHPEVLERPFFFPASSFGDVGAATGFTNACFGLHLIQRRPEINRVLLWGSSDPGNRVALTLRSPDR